MKIFITGASGFLGKRIVKKLNEAGHDLSGIARSESSEKVLTEIGVSPVSGSLSDISNWSPELSGIDAVVHCAAPVEFWGPWTKFENEIFTPTVELLEASEKAGVKRFVYISSESVLQDKKDLVDADENEPYPKSPNSYYGRAKMMSEKAICSFEGNIKSTILRPPFIWGKDMPGLESILDKVRSKDFMWVDHGVALIETVHVDNVAHAVALSLNHETETGIYFVTDDRPQTIHQFLTKLANTKNMKLPEKNIPKGLAAVAAGIMEGIWKLFRIKTGPPFSRFEYSFVGMPRSFDISKIKADLKYAPIVNEEEGLKSMES